jgi:hypothetical protein
MSGSGVEYMLENRLRQTNPDLHRRFTDTVFAMQHTLFRYLQLFPEFTDHSTLHSMSVIDFCNSLIGENQVLDLNPDAIYVLLMGCYLHDAGMGISQKEYQEFLPNIPIDEYLQRNPSASIPDIVRDFHQDFSACFVRKYAEFLEIPSPEHLFAIIQVCRGHRKTDLFDRTLFPAHWTVGDGNETYLPYLSSLIRLADEIDVTSSRNPAMIYDIERMTDEHEINFHKRHMAVHDLAITDDSFVLSVAPCEPQVEVMIAKMVTKMQETLDLCRSVVASSTPFVIRQQRVLVRRIDED